MPEKTSNDLKQNIEKIIELFQKGHLKDSLDQSNKLIEKEKNSPFLFNLNALININLKNWKNAKNSLDKAISINKEYVEAYNNLGIVYNNLGDLDKAVEKFSKSIKLKSDYANGYNNLGSVYDDLGNYEKAIVNYSKALDINPKLVEAQNNLIHILNYYLPKNVNLNPILVANAKLRNLKNNIISKEHIDTSDISIFFKNCNEIIKNNIKELAFYETQIFRRNTIDLNCKRHHKVFNKFDIIPKFCFSCYKVQIEPHNVLELFKLFFVFDNLNLPLNNTRKCTIELRPEISGTYKGLIYCSSLLEAKKVLSLINPTIKKNLSSKTKMVIRRGCSEFGISYPKYKETNKNEDMLMKYNKSWEIKEKIIDEEILKESKKRKRIINESLRGLSVNDILVMNNWLNYAKNINDISYKEISEKMFNSIYIFNAVSKQIDKRIKEFSSPI